MEGGSGTFQENEVSEKVNDRYFLAIDIWMMRHPLKISAMLFSFLLLLFNLNNSKRLADDL